MKRILSITFLGLGLCVLYATISYSRIDSTQPRLEKASILVPTGMPLRVEAATTTLPDGRNMSSLRYTVTNNSAKDLSSAQVAVFIVGTCNCIKAAEGWKEPIDLTPHSTKAFTAILKHPVPLGSRAVVAVQAVTSEAGNWEVPLFELSKSARAYAASKQIVLPAAQYKGSQTADRRNAHAPQSQRTCGFCDSAVGAANDTCGKGGVASFSCDCKNQTFSFTCKSNDEYLLME